MQNLSPVSESSRRRGVGHRVLHRSPRGWTGQRLCANQGCHSTTRRSRRLAEGGDSSQSQPPRATLRRSRTRPATLDKLPAGQYCREHPEKLGPTAKAPRGRRPGDSWRDGKEVSREDTAVPSCGQGRLLLPLRRNEPDCGRLNLGGRISNLALFSGLKTLRGHRTTAGKPAIDKLCFAVLSQGTPKCGRTGLAGRAHPSCPHAAVNFARHCSHQTSSPI